MCKKNGLDALLEDDVHSGFGKLFDVATDHNAELRHTAHSIIMALEALRLEIRAGFEAGLGYIGGVDRQNADTLGTSALQDTLAAVQMSLDDITIS
jgi:hypothetical protein